MIFTRPMSIGRSIPACPLLKVARAVSEQASEQGFADATRKQIRFGVPVGGFREEPERAPATTFVVE